MEKDIKQPTRMLEVEVCVVGMRDCNHCLPSECPSVSGSVEVSSAAPAWPPPASAPPSAA